MKKEKGFTLIELLAVIVILGIITVIAVPKVLDIINKSRESASNSSIKLVKDAIKTQVASSYLTEPVFTKETDGCYLFDFDNQESGNAKVLEIKNKDKVSGSIKYCNNTFSDDTLEFNSGDSSNKKVICKRATVLHTEECTQTDSQYYCSGAGYTTSGTKGTSIITYGNLGTKRILTSGDAFDCDVNGDGTYDPNTERFYYISDYYNTSTKSFENNTAVLVYYNNTSAGSPNNKEMYAYDITQRNWYGPQTKLVQQLPTTTQWNNVELKSTTRAILNEKNENTTTGGTLPNNFSYEGYAARLLTIQEINNACSIAIGNYNNNELDNCNYFLENTKYSSNNIFNRGYWLENPLSSNTGVAFQIRIDYRNVNTNSVERSDYFGVRPVIEVSKKNIDY